MDIDPKKKPAEGLWLQRVVDSVFLANSAPHTRRRVVRVMVMVPVWVPNKHENLSYVKS
jgi:hypothetical protein